MMNQLNKGIVSGRVEEVKRDTRVNKQGNTFIIYGVLIKQIEYVKGEEWFRSVLVEYFSQKPNHNIERIHKGDFVRCDFKIESRRWDGSGKPKYFTSAKGVGEIILENPPEQINIQFEDNEDGYAASSDVSSDDIPF